MSDPAHSALLIGIGVATIAACLLAVWGLVALLVRATCRAPQAGAAPAEERPAPSAQAVERRRRAAAAAVAVALARDHRPLRRPPVPGSGSAPSPWQAAHRQAASRGRRVVE